MGAFHLKYKGKFSSSHYLKKSKSMHGHTFLVSILIETGTLSNEFKVIDFDSLKKIIKVLDHKCVNDIIKSPTLENIARYIAEKIEILKRLDEGTFIEVEVSNSEDESIVYSTMIQEK